MRTTSSRPLSLAQLDARRLWPSLAALLLGAFLLFGVGFAQPTTLHNAAHDSRHSAAFPCH
jgi:cobalt transporter subunit CbtB